MQGERFLLVGQGYNSVAMAKSDVSYRFSAVRLKNWKNFQSVEVELPARVSGGSERFGQVQLLDVFRFLRDLVAPGGGFQAAVERRDGVKALRCLAARKDPNIEISVCVSPTDGSATPFWEYTLVFNQDSHRRPQIQQELVRRDGQVLLQRPTEKTNATPTACPRRTSSRLR